MSSTSFPTVRVRERKRRAGRDDVPRAEKERRSRVLQALSLRLGHDFAAAHLGQERKVPVETRDRQSGLLGGLTDNYLRVEYLEGEAALQGELVRVLCEVPATWASTGQPVAPDRVF